MKKIVRRTGYQYKHPNELEVSLLEIFNELHNEFKDGDFPHKKFQALHMFCGCMISWGLIHQARGRKIINRINRIYDLAFPPHPKKIIMKREKPKNRGIKT